MTPVRRQTFGGAFKVISFLATASAIGVLFGLLRMKVAALLLGPVGVGLIGLLQNASGVATTLGDMGMRQSGAREISRLRTAEDIEGLSKVRETLAWMAVVLSLVTAAPFLMFRHHIAERLEHSALSGEVGWLTVVIAATVLGAGLTAVLNGYQRVRDIGRITVISAAASCLVSVAAMWLWRTAAISVVVASAPVMMLCCSLWYVVRIRALPRWKEPTRAHVRTAAGMMKLGVFVMLSAVALSLAELSVRTSIQRELGTVELGLFAAAWTIGVYYLNFLMVATSTEFYPRLCSHVDDAEATQHAIDLQLQSMAMASAPVVIAASAFSPLALNLLYSGEFVGAGSLLRLFAVGDVFRLAVYPLGFALLAVRQGRAYFGLKLVEAVGFAGLAAVLLPRHGLTGLGIAQITTFVVLFVLYQGLLARYVGVRLSRRSLGAVGVLAGMAAALSILARVSEVAAAIAGVVLGLVWAFLILWPPGRRVRGRAGSSTG